MTCRHRDGDPTCHTKHPEGMDKIVRRELVMALERFEEWGIPGPNDRTLAACAIEVLSDAGGAPKDPTHEVLEVVERGDHLVMRVRYESCPGCSYDGDKVMVFRAKAIDAVRWKRIDPHLGRAPSSTPDPTEAPIPVARFRNTPEGWDDAILWASLRGRT